MTGYSVPGVESTHCKSYLTEFRDRGQDQRGELKDIQETGSTVTYQMWGGEG